LIRNPVVSRNRPRALRQALTGSAARHVALDISPEVLASTERPSSSPPSGLESFGLRATVRAVANTWNKLPGWGKAAVATTGASVLGAVAYGIARAVKEQQPVTDELLFDVPIDVAAKLPIVPYDSGAVGLSYQDVHHHLGNATKEQRALYTLTTGGNFEKVAGPGGTISLPQARRFLADHPGSAVGRFGLEVPGLKGGSTALADALKTITSNGDFERLAGGPGQTLTLAKLQQAYRKASAEVSALQPVKDRFSVLAGPDEKLMPDEIDAARREATDPALQAGLSWLSESGHYDQTNGQSFLADQTGDYDGRVDTDLVQRIEKGNCSRLATIYGMALTPAGKKRLEDSIVQQADGSFHVVFPGDPDHKIYVVQPSEIDGTWVHAGPAIQALATAVEKWQLDHKEINLHDPQFDLGLLAGKGNANNAFFQTPQAALDYLGEHADAVNAGRQVMLIAATTMPDTGGAGNFDGPATHTFAVTGIDMAGGTLTYHNPLFEGLHTVSLAELAKGLGDPGAKSFLTTGVM
jgi:hypothetical protein